MKLTDISKSVNQSEINRILVQEIIRLRKQVAAALLIPCCLKCGSVDLKIASYYTECPECGETHYLKGEN